MKYDDISQLPPRYQEQAKRKMAQKRMTERERAAVREAIREEKIVSGESREDAIKKKYRNQAQTVDGIRFDSQKEARRFLVLREQQRLGEIWDLRLQVNFTLQEGYTTPEGVRVRPIVYRADFAYWRDAHYIVEDVKSKATKTRVYEMKKKMLREKYGVEITEV